MSEVKYTPGPWRVAILPFPNGGAIEGLWKCCIEAKPDDLMPAIAYGATAEEAKANAELIARAPEREQLLKQREAEHKRDLQTIIDLQIQVTQRDEQIERLKKQIDELPLVIEKRHFERAAELEALKKENEKMLSENIHLARGILKVRDEIVKRDYDEAWHQLVLTADPDLGYDHWAELEALVKLYDATTKSVLGEFSPPAADKVTIQYAVKPLRDEVRKLRKELTKNVKTENVK